jgi:hypothetical protein
MKVIRDRADARWLPSRHHFALFRLFAFLRMRSAKPEPRPGLILVVDPDQTAAEHHGISLWIVSTVTCYVAATLFATWPAALALPVAFVVAAGAIEVPVVLGGLALPSRGNSLLLMVLLIAVAAYFATQRTWVRFAAWQFLALIALNAVAAMIVFLLREPIARLERGVVSES